MPAPPRRPGKSGNKSPPIFSHEFVIQNHADIISCVAMLLAIGLMFQTTSPIASLFVTLQHNITLPDEAAEVQGKIYYAYGLKDFLTIFFYILVFIVIHAVTHEYIFDKLNRRMHLSKVKHSKFNESGQLAVFYIASALFGLNIIIQENYITNISSLWESYPHVHLPSLVKFYYIAQIAYSCHAFPELYFQKVKKDEIWAQLQYITMYLVFIAAGYVLNMTRLALLLLVLHYFVELIFHVSRLLYFSEKTDLSNSGFMIWNVLFVFIRLCTITLSMLTLWYGMSKTSSSAINVADGNFNTLIVRVNCLVAIFLLQAWLMWNFITFHLRRTRERKEAEAAERATTNKKLASPKSAVKKKKAKAGGQDEGRTDDGSGGDEPTENGGSPVRHRNKAR